MRTFLLGIILLTTSDVAAGWYECYTYTGQIASYKVHLYLQLREINATSKDTIPVSGVYKYDNFNDPIVLTGILVKNQTLELNEYQSNTPYAKLIFQWNKESLVGLWQSDKKSHKIILTKVGTLVDTEREMNNEHTEILLTSSFKKEYLIGVYYKDEDDYRARMAELKIIDKKTNKIINRIKFDKEERAVGNVMTVIFGNVSAWEDVAADKKGLDIEEDDGRMGQSFSMTYDKKTGSYIRE
jgi:hypothetical protein